MVKKYISADLRVINCANDIIATSGENSINNFKTDAEQLAPSRGLFEDDYDF